MKTPLFTGSGTAIITPFSQGKPDLETFRRLIERQIACGTDAIIVCGTSGEAATLSREERSVVIQTCVQQVNGRIPVIVGSGSNHTETAIALSQEAQSLGADGLLLVTPYYNKATQIGLQRHFTAVADRVSLPIILYNVPSRTGVSCSAETYRVLSRHPNINGVKEASGNFALLQETFRSCPADFYVWSGNDEDTAAICMMGGLGVVSVASNLIPRDVHELTELCLADCFADAGALQLRLFPLIRALFSEVNPIPIKTAMAHLGLCEAELRLPLCEMGEENAARLFDAMEAYGMMP